MKYVAIASANILQIILIHTANVKVRSNANILKKKMAENLWENIALIIKMIGNNILKGKLKMEIEVGEYVRLARNQGINEKIQIARK